MSTNDDLYFGDPVDSDELVKELLELRQMVLNKSNVLCKDKELAIFRLCTGLDLDEWQSISRSLDPDVWMTLPVDGNVLPHLKLLHEKLAELAFEKEHDPLTGLANRRSFDRGLDMELERGKRNTTPLSLAIFDLDDFKKINDTYGHPKGDEVLIRFAEILKQEKRRYDLAARIGGEEFAVILSGVGSLKSQRILTRVMDKLSESIFMSPDMEDSFSVTCSIGLSTYRGRGDMRAEQLVEEADKALYNAKNQGKNRIVSTGLPDVEPIIKETLVHANEKKFLFTGG